MLSVFFFSRGRQNSFYVTSCIVASNLATEVRMGSIDAEWTIEHTCFDGIPIQCVTCLYEASIGFHWDNPYLIGNYGSIQPENEFTFPFQYNIIFETYQSFKPPSSTPGGDTHEHSLTFLYKM